MIKISSLKLNERNPRKISDAALDKLAESIQRDPEFMILRPIVIDSHGEIIGGNQRCRAIKKLGMKEIPDEWVKTADNLSDEQRKRFMLVDNAPEGMTGIWDMDILVSEWDVVDLEGLGFDVEGFLPIQMLDGKIGSSPWDKMAEQKESDMVLFTLGDIQTKISQGAYLHLKGVLPDSQESISEFISGVLKNA